MSLITELCIRTINKLVEKTNPRQLLRERVVKILMKIDSNISKIVFLHSN